MANRYVHYYGVDAPPATRMTLKAGPVSMVFEPGGGFLRYLKLGDREILRGVYVAVRDRNWGTVAPQISNVMLNDTDDGFDLSFDASCVAGTIDFFWRGRITGASDGTVTYAMEGEARSTFLRNRIGFCVLHAAAACAGDPCRVEKADGSVEDGRFPDAISPHQPFFDMRAISHEVAPGVTARVAFEGDVFEMEDQRNWTDASYKTYSTPLVLPFPVEVKKGDGVSQTVTVSLAGDLSNVQAPKGADEVTLTPTGEAPVRLPDIGLGMAAHGEALTDLEVQRLRALHLAHLRAEVHLCALDWRAAFERAVAEAQALHVKLEVALFVSDAAQKELQAFGAALGVLKPRVARWFVFHECEMATTAGWLALAQPVLKAYDAHIPLCAGTHAYFTELNRNRPPSGAFEGVCYSLNPQVHAFDHASLMETLPAQGWTVASARRFAGHAPISISPVTLRPRFNPNATGPEPDPEPGALPFSVDERQASLFCAAWTVGSLKALSQAGVQSVTYYETTGRRGVLDTEAGASAPFPSVPGGAFPVYHVLRDIGGMAGAEVVPTASSDALRAEGLVLRKGRWVRFLVANLTAQPQTMHVVYPGVHGVVRTETMDETDVEAAMANPEGFRIKKQAELGIGTVEAVDGAFDLALNPYAVVYAKAVVEA